jgi:hypothetical protein
MGLTSVIYQKGKDAIDLENKAHGGEEVCGSDPLAARVIVVALLMIVMLHRPVEGRATSGVSQDLVPAPTGKLNTLEDRSYPVVIVPVPLVAKNGRCLSTG